MALRQIREEQDPVLRKISKEVKEVTPRVKQLIDDMLDTMYNAHGVGLAAPQVGILKRIAVVDVGMEEKQPHVFINPVITRSEGKCNGTEGCLSVPGLFGFVDRPEKITVEYLDETGAQRTLDAEGFFARAICHEVDHLHGILFIDKPEFVEAVEEDEEGIDE
ncbi:peptide deformylase [Clostridiaceae bacterium HFYG-1003]|nr:peptide deformylase [Clostridiaceae bacterium HFYG-1003]